MEDEELIAKKALGIAEPGDYVSWALSALDRYPWIPELGALAGEIPPYRSDEIVSQFESIRQKLNLALTNDDAAVWWLVTRC